MNEDESLREKIESLENELRRLRQELFCAALEQTNKRHSGALMKLAIIEAQELTANQ
jgi:hypothetical protein